MSKKKPTPKSAKSKGTTKRAAHEPSQPCEVPPLESTTRLAPVAEEEAAEPASAPKPGELLLAIRAATQTAMQIARRKGEATKLQRKHAESAAFILQTLDDALRTSDGPQPRALGAILSGAKEAADHIELEYDRGEGLPPLPVSEVPAWHLARAMIRGGPEGKGTDRRVLAAYLVQFYNAQGAALDVDAVAEALNRFVTGHDRIFVSKAVAHVEDRGPRPCACADCRAKAIHRAVLRLAGIETRNRE